MNNKKPIIVGLLVLAVLVVLAFGTQAVQNAPKPPPKPTATPTQAPLTVINGLGGQIFLADPDVIARLHDVYNMRVDFKAVGSNDMVNSDLKGLDFVWPGSAVTLDEFLVAHPKAAIKYATIFRTFQMIFSWSKYKDPLLKSGMVYQKDGAYYMKMAPMVQAMVAGKTWAQLGVPEIPGPVKIAFADPETSGGGMTCFTLFANYLVPGNENGGNVVTRQTLDPIVPSLMKIWENQGRQDKASPEQFEAWVQRGSGVPLGCSSESLYLGWAKNVPSKDADLIFGIYPEYTISADHTIIGLTPGGAKLVDIFTTDKELQKIGWVNMGMRTKVAGVNAKAGDTNVTWISGDPNFTAEVTTAVSTAIKEAIKAYKNQ